MCGNVQGGSGPVLQAPPAGGVPPAEQAPCDAKLAGLSHEEVEQYLRRGFLIIQSGVAPSVHQAIRHAAGEVCSRGPHAAARLGDDVLPAIPALYDVLDSAPVQKALKGILGEGFLLHGHRHLHISTKMDQMWHKDSYWGFRKIRHHRPRWCMLLYYPQDTTLEMGPTSVLAGSQYWSQNSEMYNQGEDILSPSDGRVDMFVHGTPEQRKEKHLEAQDNFLSKRYSHLVEPVALTVPAGSCVLMHYDLFHRAGCRTTDGGPMRFMFKFQFIRTTEPAPTLTNTDGEQRARAPQAAPEVEPVLKDMRAWLRGEAFAEAVPGSPYLQVPDESPVGEQIPGPESSEVDRLAAAYRLGRGGPRGWQTLLQALQGCEASCRAATYGLCAAGPQVATSLLPFLRHESPRIRSATAFALGEGARPSDEVMDHFEAAFRVERAQMVEAAFLQALGCLASRARVMQETAICRRCVDLCMPFITPAFQFCSLRGENACLATLLAGGMQGDVSSKALGALVVVLEQTQDRYMACFAHEVLRRRQLARPGVQLRFGSDAEDCEEEHVPGCADDENRPTSEAAPPNGSPNARPRDKLLEERLTCEKKSRLTPCHAAVMLAPMSG